MNFLYRLSFSVLLLSFCVISQGYSSDQVISSDKIVAKVGNVSITLFDVERQANSIMPMKVSFHGGISPEKIAEVKKEALSELIERAYKVQYAIDEEIAVDAANLEKIWENKLSKNPKWSTATPTQLSKVKGDIYLDLLAKQAEKSAVESNITVTDDQVAAYYEANKEKYFRQKLYTASHILIKVDPAATAEEKEKRKARAQELYKRAIEGEDFYNLAYYESDDRTKFVGGSLGSFHAGQTVAEFDTAIQNMRPGQISEPVETLYGYHIIKLDSIEEARQLTLEEAAPKIREKLFKAEREKRYEEWMTKLKNKYSLEMFNQQ